MWINSYKKSALLTLVSKGGTQLTYTSQKYGQTRRDSLHARARNEYVCQKTACWGNVRPNFFIELNIMNLFRFDARILLCVYPMTVQWLHRCRLKLPAFLASLLYQINFKFCPFGFHLIFTSTCKPPCYISIKYNANKTCTINNIMHWLIMVWLFRINIHHNIELQQIRVKNSLADYFDI